MKDYLDNLPAMVDEIRSMREIIITNIVLIGQTPAPPFKETRRTRVFMERLAEFQVDECTTDGYRNPIGIIRGTDPDKPPIFAVAHLDAFYESYEKDLIFNYRIKENSIIGPGVLDNSVGVGVLVSLPAIFKKLNLRFESDIVLAGTVQSIGKANLRGVRHLLKTWPTPIRGAVCIEGIELGRLNYYSDGMIRGEIECRTSEEKEKINQFSPNAILILNEIINEILRLRLPQRPHSKIVIGVLESGANHGNIAYDGILGFEIRSDSYKLVKSIYNQINDIVDGMRHENEVELTLKTIGNLKAARLKFNHPLVKAAASVLETLGIRPVSKPTESALSIFLSRKIPAVTLGVTHGEYYYLDNAKAKIEPMFKGIAQIIGVLQAIDSGVCDEKRPG